MANTAELIKKRFGDPFQVTQSLQRAASQGVESLTEDELFMCKWLGIYTHRFEKGYFMLRTKQPNGFVTPEQLDTVADIAEKQNKGFADITTRQDFQLHWVHYKDAVGILNRLDQAGISTRGACGDIARNVVGCPVAGVDRDEILDGSLLAEQLNAYFSTKEYADLPRKFKISVSGCRTGCIHPEIQCIALTGVERVVDGKKEAGFDLRAGGGLATQAFLAKRLNVFVKPEEALEVVRALTDIWRESPEYRVHRHHARLKYLMHDRGPETLRLQMEERLGRKLDESPAGLRDAEDAFRDHVGVHAQKQPGLYYVGAPVLVGRITSQQMRRVADLCRRYGDGKSIRLTNRQNLLLLNVAESNVEKVLNALAEIELSINAHPARRGVVTCTGIQFCKLAITETKARSRQIIEYLERRVLLDEPLRIHINGCPNGCAQHQIAQIGLMGSKTKVDGQLVEAFDIFLGGQMGRDARFNHAVLRKVPATECARRLERLLVIYRKARKGKETFNAWCDRVGDAKLVGILTEDAAHPLAVEEAPVGA